MLTNHKLYDYFFRYHEENPNASVCPLLGPICFVLWIIPQRVGYDHSDFSRVVLLNDLMLYELWKMNDK